jgi:hypothetical protein
VFRQLRAVHQRRARRAGLRLLRAGENFNQLPPGEQRKRAIEFMQQKQVLLVWDNFESTLPQFNDAASPYTDDERAASPSSSRDLTRGPGRGAVLVTCRPGETGLPGAGRHELNGLARADSLWLLAEILQRHDVRLSDPRLSRESSIPLLDDLADHPLSLELVGPHLKTLTPEAIRADFAKLLARFEQERRPLPTDGKGRNSSLLASLEFSLRHLSAAARARCRGSACSAAAFSRPSARRQPARPETWEPIRDELQRIALVRVEDEIQIANRPFLHFHPTLAAAAADAPRAAAGRRGSASSTSIWAGQAAVDKAMPARNRAPRWRFSTARRPTTAAPSAGPSATG